MGQRFNTQILLGVFLCFFGSSAFADCRPGHRADISGRCVPDTAEMRLAREIGALKAENAQLKAQVNAMKSEYEACRKASASGGAGSCDKQVAAWKAEYEACRKAGAPSSPASPNPVPNSSCDLQITGWKNEYNACARQLTECKASKATTTRSSETTRDGSSAR